MIHQILTDAGGQKWSNDTFVFPNNVWIKADWKGNWYLYQTMPNTVGVHNIPINIESVEQILILVNSIKK